MKHTRIWLLSGLTTFLIFSGALSISLGQDANWDLKNYHIYNAWGFFEQRLEIDLFAAGIQTYFNPLLDLPYYIFSVELFLNKPKTVAFIMGLPFGILAFLTFLCALKITNDFNVNIINKYLLAIFATVFGLTGSANIPLIGTTFNDTQIAAIIISGITLIIWNIKNTPNVYAIIISGILFGSAAGLKLTAAIYAPSVAMAIFFISKNSKYGFANMFFFSTSWLVAFLVFYGWWGLSLYELTGNPVFPMFNQFFASSWIELSSGTDNRFKPDSLFKAIFYPFYWLNEQPMIVAEPKFSDPRFAIGMIAIGIILIKIYFEILYRKLNLLSSTTSIIPSSAKFILIFTALSYIIWEIVFSILRYAVIIESLLGIIVVISILFIMNLKKAVPSFKGMHFILFTLMILIVINTSYPQWGRVNFDRKSYFVEDVKLPDNSLVIMLGPPTAYIIPSIATKNINTSFIGITNEILNSKKYILWKKIIDKITLHQGGVFILYRPENIYLTDVINELGLKYLTDTCKAFSTHIDDNLKICKTNKLQTHELN